MGIIQKIFNFDDIGQKIKNWTKWYCWISILLTWIGAVIGFVILLWAEGTFFIAFLVPIAAILCSVLIWIGSWKMYAFGEYVENIQAMKNPASTIYHIDKKLKIIAQPLIDEANEKAKQQAEEKAKQQAEEKAKQQAEEKAKYEAKKRAEQTIQKKEKTLSEKLEYALLFQTDDGMFRYLSGIQDENVQNILKSPQHLIREQIKNLLDNM